MSYIQVPVTLKAGIEPEPDSTEQGTVYCIDGNNIRFFRGKAETMGGSRKEVLDNDFDGVARSAKSFNADGKNWQIIGTNSKLYAKLGSSVTNITPLKTTNTALAADPVATNTATNASGRTTLTITHTAHGHLAGDRVKLSGATTTNGVTDTVINAEHIIVTAATNSYTISVVGTASSTGSGGGASVLEFEEIDAGAQSAVPVSGSWVGIPWQPPVWGIQTDTSLLTTPRIWWQDTFGDTWVGGITDGGKVYQWLGDTDVAPTVVANAPDAVWGWVEDARLHILDGNTTANSNTGNTTQWTPSSSSSAFSDDREDATKLISQCYVNGENLVFADENKVFRMRWVGGAVKWIWQKLSDSVGIVSPFGRVVVDGVAYVFAKDNFYYYNGGVLLPLPNCTLRKYVFENINLAQRYKFFVWHNAKYNELHFHYASAGSEENDRAVVFSISEGHWTKREGITRSGADTSGNPLDYPVLLHPTDGTYQHEVGYDNGTEAQDVFVQLAYSAALNGLQRTEVHGIEPDLILNGTVNVSLYGKERSAEDGKVLKSFLVSGTSRALYCTRDTRWRSWRFSQNQLGGFMRLGSVKEFLAKGSKF
jgi:hypothetical protein